MLSNWRAQTVEKAVAEHLSEIEAGDMCVSFDFFVGVAPQIFDLSRDSLLRRLANLWFATFAKAEKK